MFSGSLVAIVTPMRPDGAIDLEAWERLIDLHLESGTAGIVIGGTTGESPTLDESELRELATTACSRVKRRIPIVIGAGTSSTAASVERARRLSELPVDGLLVVTPAYNRPTQQGLYGHFACVAQASRLPLILYNVPSRTAVDMLPETVAKLSRLPGIVAVKEAVPDPARVQALLGGCSTGFTVLSGDDATARQSMLAGARGVISVTANVAPRAMAAMADAAMRADAHEAQACDAPLALLHRDLFLEANPIPAKWALATMGLIEGGIRLPLTELSEVHRPRVLDALRAAGAVT